MKNEALYIKDLSFAYDEEDRFVWQGLNLLFQENKVNLILGPSGCGKSSLLYALSGLIPFSIEGNFKGEIYVQDKEISNRTPQERSEDMGVLFQNPDSQFCTFTVEDEIAFGLENRNTPREQMDTKIQEALNMVNMENFRKEQLSNLSGGQKQKIAIASILAMDTRYILMDEPTANLDAVSRRDFFELLKTLVENYGKTILLVEHNLEGLMEQVDYILVIDEKGNVVLNGEKNSVMPQLILNPEYRNLGIFLPYQDQIVRSFAKENPDSSKIKKMWEKYQNKYPIERNDILEVLEVDQKRDTQEEAHRDRNDLIKVQNLKFAYQPGKSIIKGLNFTIHQGDFFAILGANGVGKSTLMNLIFKVYSNYEGSISYSGKEIRKLKSALLYEKAGLVFQNPELQFVTNQVDQELYFSIAKQKLSEQEKLDRVQNMLDKFHLTAERGKSPFSLSQGQKRRLSVATMMMTEQEILFLDEPTFGQDYENTLELMDFLQQMNQDGMTIVMITHDMQLVADYANRAVVIDQGRAIFEGAPEKLFQKEEILRRSKLEQPPSYKMVYQEER